MPSSYSLGEHFDRFVREQVATGRFQSASEVIRNALRLMEERDENRREALSSLRHALEVGRSSGAGIPADVLRARLHARYQTATTSGTNEG